MGTHYRGEPREVKVLDAYIKLMRCVSSVQGRLDPALDAENLTENQFGVLEVLLHLGPLPQSVLGTKLFTGRPNITKLVDHLQARGLVKRERSEADRRSITVHLTPEGRRLIKRLFPQHLERIVGDFAVLDDSQVDQLGRLCRKLGRRRG